MVPILKHRSLTDFATMSEQDMSALLARVHELQSAVRAGTARHALRGKNFGLLCGDAEDEQTALFERAASALGAQVAHVRPSLSEFSSQQDVQHTARVLGRLYDAVDCNGMAPSLVRRIGAEAGVPVFEGIASPQHPTARLVDMLEDGGSDEEKRCLVIQAVLLNALA